ncbi:hypothetical protein [Corynebacterium marquesiae]|uniref:hypothetical protein n=1 Tax=Corynebacterium marquesiae TaxID=2913503 RepID=UPI0038D12000
MTATLSPPEPDIALDYPDTLLIGDHPDTGPLDDGDVPEAFYTTNAPGNHIGQAGTYTRKTSWFLYRAILPQLDDDVDLSLTSLAKDLGISYSKLLGYIRAHFRIRQLPLVTEVQGHHWILDLTKLRIIDRELNRLDNNPEHLEAIDAALADFLTPTTPNQTVPTDADLRRFIRTFIDTHLRPEDKEQQPQPTLRINYNPDNTTTLSLTCDSATATIIPPHRRLHQPSRNHRRTRTHRPDPGRYPYQRRHQHVHHQRQSQPGLSPWCRMDKPRPCPHRQHLHPPT